MSEEKELVNFELLDGKVQLQIPASHKESLEKLFADPKFNAKILEKDKIGVIATKDGDSQDLQTAWTDFGSCPSVMSLYFDMLTADVWSALETNFAFDHSNINKKSELYFNSNNDVIENSKYLIKLFDGLYVSFVEMGNDFSEDNLINSMTFYYDSKKYEHGEISQQLVEMFASSIIMYNKAKESKVYVANYYDDGFEFEPYDLEKVTLNLKGEKKKTYDNIVNNINQNKKGTYILYGKRESGKTSFLKKILKNVKKKIIYVPIDCFEHAFINKNFFNHVKNYGDCLIVFEDCEMYFKTNTSINFYAASIMKFNDSLISNNTNFNCIFIMNIEDLAEICSDLSESNKISYISMKDEIASFKGYV